MIEAKGVTKVYNNGSKAVVVLKGVDLIINDGSFIALIGPSGAGKSTLLHILGGLDEPSEGKVILNGRDISLFDDASLSKMRNGKIGFVFQFYHLLSEFTVEENVLMPALIRASGSELGAGSRSEALELLKKVGLADRAAHFPSQLSGGERQRVAIARALINKPEIIFCDEPTGNLDSATGNDIIALIKEITQENKMADELVTHNIELTKLADSVYHLKDGVLVN